MPDGSGSGRRARPVTVPVRSAAMPPPARAVGAQHNPRFKDPHPNRQPVLSPPADPPQPSPYATTPMPEDFMGFMGAAAPQPGGVAGPVAPIGGPVQEAQLARARAAGRRPPPRAATADQAAAAAATAARQRQSAEPPPVSPEEAEARRAEEREHEAALVRELDAHQDLVRDLDEFSRVVEDHRVDEFSQHAAEMHRARGLEPGRPTKDIDDMTRLDFDGQSSHPSTSDKYLATERTVPGTATTATSSVAAHQPRAMSAAAGVDVGPAAGAGDWGGILLNDRERRILFEVLGAVVPIDLTYVTVAQIEALPDGLRAVTRGKLQALRQELLDGTGAAVGGSAAPRKGRRRCCGCCGSGR
jgi:hypothetical protein